MENSPNSRALAVQLLNQAANLIRGMEQSQLTNSAANLSGGPPLSNASRFVDVPGSPLHYSTSRFVGVQAQGLLRTVAPQNGQLGMTSRPAPPVLSEMRQQFSPYSTGGRRRGNQSRIGSSPSPLVNLQMFCLGGPRDTMTPDIERKSLLMALDLAQGVVSIARGATSTDFQAAIRTEYPRLQNTEFEILRAIGPGSRRLLQRISRTSSIPVPAVIKDLRVTVAYIRPMENIVPADTENASDEVSDNEGPVEDEPAVPRSSRSAFQQLFGRPSQSANSSTSSISAHGGFNFSIDLDSSSVDELGQYRQSLFETNEGREMIMVSSRENILQELLGIYKNPSFNFKKKTWVMFAGEDGRDVNGLTKEFFSIGISTLQTGRIGNHPLFEGQLDHLLPTCDPFLLNSGYFRVLGKFMAHAAVHVGVGFIGLSSSVVQYLFQKDGGDEEPLIEYCLEDIPDLEIRSAAQLMQDWTVAGRQELDAVTKIKNALEEAQIFESPTAENIHFLFQQFLMWSTILCRATILNEIREGFKSTGFMQFFQEREHLLAVCFPSDASLNYSASDVLTKVTYMGEETDCIRAIFEPIVEAFDSKMIRKLLQCWTGFPVIPSDGLSIKGTPDVSFVIHTCFNQIEVPVGITSEEFKNSICHALEYCTYGFGSV